MMFINFKILWVKAPLYQKLQKNEYSRAVRVDEEGDQGGGKINELMRSFIEIKSKKSV